MNQGFSFLAVFSGAFGALIGAVVAIVLGIWKFHRDEISARCDELCKVIVDAGTISADYWSQEFKPDELHKARVLEAKLLSMQSLIDSLSADLIGKFYSSDNLAISLLLSEMVDGLTGGNFSVAGRGVDELRIRKSAEVAGQLVAAIRLGHRQTMPPRNWLSATT